jgi:hypothetical protein
MCKLCSTASYTNKTLANTPTTKYTQAHNYRRQKQPLPAVFSLFSRRPKVLTSSTPSPTSTSSPSPSTSLIYFCSSPPSFYVCIWDTFFTATQQSADGAPPPPSPNSPSPWLCAFVAVMLWLWRRCECVCEWSYFPSPATPPLLRDGGGIMNHPCSKIWNRKKYWFLSC